MLLLEAIGRTIGANKPFNGPTLQWSEHIPSRHVSIGEHIPSRHGPIVIFISTLYRWLNGRRQYRPWLQICTWHFSFLIKLQFCPLDSIKFKKEKEERKKEY